MWPYAWIWPEQRCAASTCSTPADLAPHFALVCIICSQRQAGCRLPWNQRLHIQPMGVLLSQADGIPRRGTEQKLFATQPHPRFQVRWALLSKVDTSLVSSTSQWCVASPTVHLTRSLALHTQHVEGLRSGVCLATLWQSGCGVCYKEKARGAGRTAQGADGVCGCPAVPAPGGLGRVWSMAAFGSVAVLVRFPGGAIGLSGLCPCHAHAEASMQQASLDWQYRQLTGTLNWRNCSSDSRGGFCASMHGTAQVHATGHHDSLPAAPGLSKFSALSRLPVTPLCTSPP